MLLKYKSASDLSINLKNAERKQSNVRCKGNQRNMQQLFPKTKYVGDPVSVKGFTYSKLRSVTSKNQLKNNYLLY